MKATGIIRRIDDLGRVVIPKEVRRNLGLREGDPLEIYTEGRAVCFVKYSALDDMAAKVQPIVNGLNKIDILCALYDNCDCKICGDKNAPDKLEYDDFNPCYYAIRADGEFIGFLAVANELPDDKQTIKFAVRTIETIMGSEE